MDRRRRPTLASGARDGDEVAVVEWTTNRHRGRVRSALDLFDGRLALLVGDGAPRWRSAANERPAPVQVLALDEQQGPAAERLRTVYEVGSGGAVLVRPHGYMALRSGLTAEPRIRCTRHSP